MKRQAGVICVLLLSGCYPGIPYEALLADGGPGGGGGEGGGGEDGGAGDGGTDPFAVPPRCTSGSSWSAGNQGSDRMHPGLPCIDCHRKAPVRPQFAIAGTVYPSAHEPDDCNSALPAGVSIVVTDANNASVSLTPNGAGNFFTLVPPAPPYRVKVTLSGRERAMSATVTSGDCNSCHTQFGANGAPGRILLP